MLITFHFLLISKLPAKLGILIFVSLGEKKWNLKGLSKFFNVMKLGSDKISSWFQVSISIAKRFPPVTHLPWRKEKGECLDFEEISPERVCSGNWGKSLAIFLTWKSCCAKIYISHWLFFFLIVTKQKLKYPYVLESYSVSTFLLFSHKPLLCRKPPTLQESVV